MVTNGRFNSNQRLSHQENSQKGTNEDSYGYMGAEKARKHQNSTLDYDFSHDFSLSDKRKRDFKEYFNQKKFVTAPSKKKFLKNHSTSRERDTNAEEDLVIQDRSDLQSKSIP